MKKLLVIFAISFMSLFSVTLNAQMDRDMDNDGIWDYDRGGTDRDLDNDGIWD